ncbi:hypothetical protein C7N43_37805 [Sphingobacteriales bacterium UPWRP_1]|nr:hypothetical protein BVG80_17970 [Sphingobacteriales bacterium TSM_CSM]PSJ71733.1 hypothetical protein C7N43_37805 [Sphingobacteriales bacterium UPWRP_1]
MPGAGQPLCYTKARLHNNPVILYHLRCAPKRQPQKHPPKPVIPKIRPVIPKFRPVIPFCFFAVANLLSFGNGNPKISVSIFKP